MAKKGIRYCVFAKATPHNQEDIGFTYDEATRFSPVASISGSISSYNAKDWGDDRAVEVASGISSGSLALELNYDDHQTETYLLGHWYDGSQDVDVPEGATIGNVIAKETDEAPLVGVAVISHESNQLFGLNWVVKIYSAVKFSEPNDENQTETDSVTFGHINLDGKIFFAKAGRKLWKREFSCNSEGSAKGIVGTFFGTITDTVDV